MTKKFSTMGSCSSRNIFSGVTNQGYKNFFTINYSIEAVSLISLMSKRIEFDNNLINSDHEYDNFCVINDLTKKYLEILKKTNLDYLVFDTFFDVYSNVIVVDKNTFVTGSPRISHTEFGNTLEDCDRLNIDINFEEYMVLWTHACDSFFKFLEKHCKNIKIILNCSRPVYNYYSSNGEIIYDSPRLKQIIPITHNKYRNILDEYILKNFDVEILSFDYNSLAYEDHVFGLHPTHYTPRFYKEKTVQLNRIISRNNYLEYNDKLNVKFRKLIQSQNILKNKLSS